MDVLDGKGRGYRAEVSKLQELLVAARSYSPMAKASELGDAFAWVAVSADIDAGDTALLVANNSQTRKLRIGKVYAWCDVAQQFKIHLPSYPTLSGTVVVGKCLNAMLNKTADASAYADETGNTFAAANSVITLRNNELATDEFSVEHDFEGVVILGYHHCIAVDLVAEPGAFECAIFGWYEDN